MSEYNDLEQDFTLLMTSLRRNLLHCCKKVLLSDQEVEDVVQSAMIQAWEITIKSGHLPNPLFSTFSQCAEA